MPTCSRSAAHRTASPTFVSCPPGVNNLGREEGGRRNRRRIKTRLALRRRCQWSDGGGGGSYKSDFVSNLPDQALSRRSSRAAPNPGCTASTTCSNNLKSRIGRADAVGRAVGVAREKRGKTEVEEKEEEAIDSWIRPLISLPRIGNRGGCTATASYVGTNTPGRRKEEMGNGDLALPPLLVHSPPLLSIALSRLRH